MKLLKSIELALLFGVITHSVRAQYQIQFMASDTSWVDSEYVGHAFMVISTRTAMGSKEDAYGFYPRTLKAVIHGPGVINSEFTRNPSRFSRVTVSIQRPITDEQRSAIMKLIAGWNEKTYDLTARNCNDFVNSVATMLDWTVPTRDSTDLPETFLRKLKAANDGHENETKKGIKGNTDRQEINGVEMQVVDKTHLRFENLTNTSKLVVFDVVVTNPFLQKDETYHAMGIPLEPKEHQLYDYAGWTFISAKLISAKP